MPRSEHLKNLIEDAYTEILDGDVGELQKHASIIKRYSIRI